jgi:hypothetical protein
MNNIARQSISPNKLAAKFNERFPVGTRVRYWTGSRDGIGKVSHTRTEAQVIGGHTAVVWLEDQTGCVALSHIEPLAA